VAGYLCGHHADLLKVPRGWDLHDRRNLAPMLPPLPPEALPEPEKTPLLARAFRAARAS
jgi:hypothetical protein